MSRHLVPMGFTAMIVACSRPPAPAPPLPSAQTPLSPVPVSWTHSSPAPTTSAREVPAPAASARSDDGGGSSDAAEPVLLSSFTDLRLGVAYHYRPGTTQIEKVTIHVAGGPGRGGSCPSCLNLTAAINGRPTHTPARPRPQEPCTRIRKAPERYRSCERSDDAWLDEIDAAAFTPNEREAVTTVRVSDGTETYTASFANLFAERKLVPVGAKSARVRVGQTLELALAPNTDRIQTEDQGVTPDAELWYSDNSHIPLETELTPDRVLLRFGPTTDAILGGTRNRVRPGAATVVLRFVHVSVGEVQCTGPRFCTAAVPGLYEERRIPVVVAP